MSKIIITRESQACMKSVRKLRDLGFDAHPFPLLKIEPVGIKLPSTLSNTIVIITSPNAIPALKSSLNLHNNHFIVVGQTTANDLSKIGITPIYTAKNSIELLEYIKQTFHNPANFLYLSGDHISTDIPSELAALQHSIERIIVYRSIIRDVSQELSVLEGAEIFLFYSRRAAEAFADLNLDVSQDTAISISHQVADVLKTSGFKSVIVSTDPSEDSIIKLL